MPTMVGAGLAERNERMILGESGAGMSVLLIWPLLDPIDRRADTAPVPVLFSLAS